MSCTPTQARDDLYKLVTDAWGVTGPLDYEDRPRGPLDPLLPPLTPIPWARLMMRHTLGNQVTLANGLGNRRFRRYGFFTAQVFCPLGSSLRTPETLGKLVNDALEGVATPHGVLLRNVRMNEIGPDGSNGQWYQINVIADFEYDEEK